jgi:hypothetical protein
MAHVSESDASTAADSTAFRARAPAFASHGVAAAEPAGWSLQSFAPPAPASTPGDHAALPMSFGAATAR